MGRQILEITCTSDTTFADFQVLAEKQSGIVDGGLRFLHKGSSSPQKTLAEVNIKDGTKIMALRSAKQVAADKDKEKLAKLRKAEKDILQLKDSSGAKGVASSSSASASGTSYVGDEKIEGASHVILIKGKLRVRVNIDMSSSVWALKEKAASFQEIGSAPRNIRLMFKGGFLKDDSSLADCTVKSGASLMVLFTARHHDEVEDAAEMSSIEGKVQELEQKAKRIRSQLEHRLLDDVDLKVAKGELEEAVNRLRDNVESVRSIDARKATLLGTLNSVQDLIARM